MSGRDRGTALVRRPTEDLADGIVTHVERVPVDAAPAAEQHAGYRAALAEAGWEVPEPLEPGVFPVARPVTEEAGCHVVPLGGDRVPQSTSA